jgi:hypothetical protein
MTTGEKENRELYGRPITAPEIVRDGSGCGPAVHGRVAGVDQKQLAAALFEEPLPPLGKAG